MNKQWKEKAQKKEKMTDTENLSDVESVTVRAPGLIYPLQSERREWDGSYFCRSEEMDESESPTVSWKDYYGNSGGEARTVRLSEADLDPVEVVKQDDAAWRQEQQESGRLTMPIGEDFGNAIHTASDGRQIPYSGRNGERDNRTVSGSGQIPYSERNGERDNRTVSGSGQIPYSERNGERDGRTVSGDRQIPYIAGYGGEEIPTAPIARPNPPAERSVEGEVLMPAGWLVCTGGPEIGHSFPLRIGKNRIGRAREGEHLEVNLAEDRKISRSTEIYLEYREGKRIFLLSVKETNKNLVYLDEELLRTLQQRQMRKNQTLKVGDSSLMLIPCCDEAFEWKDVTGAWR